MQPKGLSRVFSNTTVHTVMQRPFVYAYNEKGGTRECDERKLPKSVKLVHVKIEDQLSNSSNCGKHG